MSIGLGKKMGSNSQVRRCQPLLQPNIAGNTHGIGIFYVGGFLSFELNHKFILLPLDTTPSRYMVVVYDPISDIGTSNEDGQLSDN